jgi:glycine/D-amino acid oxidase-like deaminating enzyme
MNNMPIFLWQESDGRYYYGIPDDGEGVKTAIHHSGEFTTPDLVRRHVTPEDEFPVREFLRRHMPWADGPLVSSTTCLYTDSPDEHFIIDFHPRHGNIIMASACSGHGFKFASVVGEIVSDLAVKGRTEQDISLFRLSRPELRVAGN